MPAARGLRSLLARKPLSGLFANKCTIWAAPLCSPMQLIDCVIRYALALSEKTTKLPGAVSPRPEKNQESG